MQSFKTFLGEYNTTGEVDAENNTDLEKPVDKTRWWAAKRKCGLGGVPCSKYSAQMKKEGMNSFTKWLEAKDVIMKGGVPVDALTHEPINPTELGRNHQDGSEPPAVNNDPMARLAQMLGKGFEVTPSKTGGSFVRDRQSGQALGLFKAEPSSKYPNALLVRDNKGRGGVVRDAASFMKLVQ